MKLNLDSQPIELTCPGCSKKFSEQIGRVKHSPTITCPGCRQPIKLDAHQLRRSIDTVQKSLDQLGRSLRKLGK
jgi:transcription elongation factor Elf1